MRPWTRRISRSSIIEHVDNRVSMVRILPMFRSARLLSLEILLSNHYRVVAFNARQLNLECLCRCPDKANISGCGY